MNLYGMECRDLYLTVGSRCLIEEESGGILKSERGWPGIVCCFMLFIVVCGFLLLNKDVDIVRSPGHRELGLLLFIVPGLFSALMIGGQTVLRTVVGALLAVPVCLLMIRNIIDIPRSMWQELAWLSSAVFWSALGTLCFQFLRIVLVKRRRS